MAETHDEVHALLAELLPVLAPLARWDADTASVLVPFEDGRARINAEQLVRACQGQPREVWPGLVEKWLRSVMDSAANSGGADVDPVDGTKLRLWIVPRLDEVQSERYAVLPYGDYFDALPVTDALSHVERLTWERLSGLGSMEEVQQLAINNTVQYELATFDIRDHEVVPGKSVRLVAKDGSPFVSSGLLSIEKYLSGDGGNGVLVSVPSYSMMLLHEVQSREVMNFIPAFHDMTHGMYEQAASPCAKQIFWWVGGDFYPVGVSQADGQVEVTIPEEIKRLVATL